MSLRVAALLDIQLSLPFLLLIRCVESIRKWKTPDPGISEISAGLLLLRKEESFKH